MAETFTDKLRKKFGIPDKNWRDKNFDLENEYKKALGEGLKIQNEEISKILKESTTALVPCFAWHSRTWILKETEESEALTI